ncbi:hypothetical protein [Clostridium sp.]
MTNFIIPAIITLIISITSGLMLDYYKNLAPKILGNVQNGIPTEMNSKKLCSYIITVSNPSNKTIHELTLNIQSSQTNLKSTGATITKGLKFDSSIKDNILEVYIPFLSKGDKFSVTAYVENQDAVHNKPVLVIRSPENFNQINSLKQKGSQLLWFNIPKNINQVILKAIQNLKGIMPNTKDDFTTVMSKKASAKQTTNKKDRQVLTRNKKPSKNKKAMIITVSIILFMVIGVLEKFYFRGMSTKLTTTPNAKTTITKESNGTRAAGVTTVTTDATKSTTGNTGTIKSTGSTEETTEATSPKKSTIGTSGSTGSTAETSGSEGLTGSKTETKGTKESTTVITDSTGGTSGTTDPKGSTSGTVDSTGAEAGTTSSAGSTSGTTDSTSGTPETTVK